MVKTSKRAVLDTNILISGFLFGGIPREVYLKVVAKELDAFTSEILLAELYDTLRKKFKFSDSDLKLVKSQMNENFKMVFPKKEINILEDDPDNRVLEAACDGKCDFIVTGDKAMLTLKKYKNIQILTASEFIKVLL